MNLMMQVSGHPTPQGQPTHGHPVPLRSDEPQAATATPAAFVTQIPAQNLGPNQTSLSVLSRVANQQLSGLTRIATAGGAQHVVQHHPPPLRMVHIPNTNGLPVSAAAAFSAFPANSVVTSVALPSSPSSVAIRHVMPQASVGGRPHMSRSPVRQHQLSQAPILRHQITSNAQGHQRLVPTSHSGGQIRATYHSMKVGGTGTFVLTQRPQPALAMLPQTAGTSGILPSVPSQNLISNSGSNLITFPLKLQSQSAPSPQPPPPPSRPSPQQQKPHHHSVVPPSSNQILPPNLVHHQLFPAVTQADPDECEVAEEALPPRTEWCCRNPTELWDHSYVSLPPKSPPPQSVQQLARPMLREVLEEFKKDQKAEEPIENSRNHSPYKLQQPPVGLAEVVSEPPASNTTAGEGLTSKSLPPRVQANLNSIEEAGVGPMAPLLDDEGSRMSVSSNDDRGGEETETAPEAEGEDDSVTRCICDYVHDDGYMICCDKCLVWQHVVCMGLDKNNIPDEYLCEICKPRPVDRKRAKVLQTRRREEIFAHLTSSDEEKRARGVRRPNLENSLLNNSKKRQLTNAALINNKNKSLDRKVDVARGRKPKKLEKKLSPSTVVGDVSNGKGGKIKKTYRKRKQSEKRERNPSGKRERNPSTSSRKLSRRKSSHITTDEEGDNDSVDEADVVDTDVDRSHQQLRSWIDQYEEAVTNHYSQELRARLSGNKFAGVGNELRASVIGAASKCSVSLKGNGIKILTASSNLPCHTPIIECKGKLMLASQYRSPGSKGNKDPSPHVFFYRLGDQLKIVVDQKTYGNDSRFCRRSANFNAELRHVLDKGSLHLFIVTVKNVEKNQEILLPIDSKEMDSPTTAALLPSISSEVREMKKPVNGVLNFSTDDEPLASARLEGRKKKERKKTKRVSVSEDSLKRKTLRGFSPIKVEPDVKEEVKEEEPELKEEEPLSDQDKPLANMKQEKEVSVMSPSKHSGKHPHSTMLGLPDNSGLIVGVNTINYDASSSVKNKAKTREEKKMEMIMKAFEAMERKQQRKKDTVEEKTILGAKRRRRSSSTVKLSTNESNVDVSSADETKPEPKRTKRRGRKVSTALTPKRRRSRALSGGTASALSTDEDHANPIGGPDMTSTPGSTSGPFRFPKTKKTLMTDWLQETNDSIPNDDDVSANYLRGSRSPPGIATHLLRASTQFSPVKSVCSAKKRWLRQAISEDHTDEAPVNGNSSPSDAIHGGDYVTPLKKRRLASYKDDQEQDPVSPNGLKNKFLSNLVLEAVLDRALEDMGGGTVTRSDSVDSMMSPNADSCMSNSHSAFEDSPSKDARRSVENSPEGDEGTEEELVVGDQKQESDGEIDIEGESSNQEPDESQDHEEPEQEVAKEESFDVDVENLSAVKEEEEEEEVGVGCEQAPEEFNLVEKCHQDDSKVDKDSEVKEEDEPFEVDPPQVHNEDANFGEDTNYSLKDEDLEPISSSDAEQESPIKEDSPQKTSPIKTPEPSSVFKSFFTSNVSIEELEAEIEATKKCRLDDEQGQSFSIPDATASFLNMGNSLETPATGLSIDPPAEEKKVDVSQDVAAPLVTSDAKVVDGDIKPKEKKRFSLADYKKRRQSEGISIKPEGQSRSEDGPGTPTLDEELATLAAPPTLNTLPLFEKLDTLEKAQHANKKIVQTPSVGGIDCLPGSPPEPKREDLTERLKKEFGLTIEDDEEEEEGQTGNENTETETSPALPPLPPLPPPPPSSAPPPPSLNRHSSYPGYPSSYGSYSSTKYSSGSTPFREGYPPPPPPSVIANAPHPPPSVARSESVNHCRSNGVSSSGRRPGVSSSKEYYSHSSGSRGYYSGSRSRDRDRDYRDHRDRDYHHHRSSSSKRNSFHNSGGRTYYQ